MQLGPWIAIVISAVLAFIVGTFFQSTFTLVFIYFDFIHWFFH